MTDEQLQTVLAEIRELRELLERATVIARFSSHDLRRTCITGLLDASGDLLFVQNLAGHADPKTTKRYDRRGEQGRRRTTLFVDMPYEPA